MTQLTAYVDEGAWALDDLDGDVTVTTIGLASVDTSLPTAPNSPLVLTYTAMDAAGNLASPKTRAIVVLAKCPTPSFVCVESQLCATCVDGVCLCLSAEAAPEQEQEPPYVPPVDELPPVLTLLGDGERALIVGVAGVPDVPVAIERVPLGAVWADAGATAMDLTDGVLDASGGCEAPPCHFPNLRPNPNPPSPALIPGHCASRGVRSRLSETLHTGVGVRGLWKTRE